MAAQDRRAEERSGYSRHDPPAKTARGMPDLVPGLGVAPREGYENHLRRHVGTGLRRNEGRAIASPSAIISSSVIVAWPASPSARSRANPVHTKNAWRRGSPLKTYDFIDISETRGISLHLGLQAPGFECELEFERARALCQAGRGAAFSPIAPRRCAVRCSSERQAKAK